MSSIQAVVEKYIQLRDEKASVSERHKAEMAPFNEQMEVIEKWLLQEMDRMGVDSLKTPAGTPYKSITKSVKTTDIEAFKAFVFSTYVPQWDLVDFRAGKKGIQEYTEQNGIVPPGISLDSFTTINIRRG